MNGNQNNRIKEKKFGDFVRACRGVCKCVCVCVYNSLVRSRRNTFSAAAAAAAAAACDCLEWSDQGDAARVNLPFFKKGLVKRK